MSYTDFDFPHTHMYDSDLREILCKLKKLIPTVESLLKWKDDFEDEYNEFLKFISDIESGNLPDGFEEAINNWMARNAIDLVGNLVNMVIFNITDDGYFVAYIPESWDEIQFGTTGLDVTTDLQPDYGHLVLSYEASTRAYN